MGEIKNEGKTRKPMSTLKEELRKRRKDIEVKKHNRNVKKICPGNEKGEI